MVKCYLTLKNGNASVEGSLSDNENTLAPERALLSDETLIGLCRMNEVACNHKGAQNIPIATSCWGGIPIRSYLKNHSQNEHKMTIFDQF